MNSINRNVATGFVLASALLAATAVLFWRNAEQTMKDAQNLAVHHKVVSSLQDATIELYKAEHAQRDFVLSSGKANLESSQEALFSLEAALASASKAAPDQESRQALAKLGETLAQQVLLLQRAFEAVATKGGRAAAVRLLEDPLSKLRLDDIGKQMDALKLTESQRLKDLWLQLAQREDLGRRWMYLCMFLATLLFSGLAWLVNLELKARNLAEQVVLRQEKTLRSILHEMQDGVLVVGVDHKILTINPTAERQITLKAGLYDPESWVKQGVYRDEGMEPFKPSELPLMRALAGENVKDAKLYVKNDKFREGLHLLVSANPVYDEHGKLACAVAVLRDVTRDHRGQMDSLRNQAILQDTVSKVEARNQQIGMLGGLTRNLQACQTVQELCDACNGTVQKLLPGFDGHLHILNNSKTLLVPQLDWAAPGKEPSVVEAFSPQDCWAMRRGQPHGMRPDRPGPVCGHLEHQKPHWALCQPLAGQGEMLGILSLSSDSVPENAPTVANLVTLISEQLGMGLANLRLREKLHVQSIRDPLTSLYNRRYLEEVVERELERSRRSTLPVAFLTFDIDHFKRYNDQHGHDAGDQVLRQLSQCLRESARTCDVVCRVGGEEIVVLMPEADIEAAEKYYSVVQQALLGLDLFYLGRRLDPITLSAGAACFPRDGEDFATVMQRADSALYEAKKTGRNRLIRWREIHA